jgi:uncharacterized protein YbjT (DUF2867 family)
MKILLTGATGLVGSHVLKELLGRGLQVRALLREPSSSESLSAEAVKGDLTDPDSVREALKGVDKLYLLNAVVPDELTQALIAVGLAKAAGVRHIVYHSVYEAQRFKDVPHFASKWCLEQSLLDSGVPHTVIRPNYFHQNDAALKGVISGKGVYPMPLGPTGVSSVDVRDIAEATATALASDAHVGETIDLVGPAQLTGPGAANIWSGVLGREVRYAGHNMDTFESQVKEQGAPGWQAFDLRLMFQGYLERGFVATSEQVTKLTELLGHPPRPYEDFARETAVRWKENEPR